jgi:hypothetical protein
VIQSTISGVTEPTPPRMLSGTQPSLPGFSGVPQRATPFSM